MGQLELRKRVGGRPAKRVYQLAGLLIGPEGEKWQGDGGSYRLGKGVRINAAHVDASILAQLIEDLSSEDMAAAIASYYRTVSKESESQQDGKSIQRRIEEIDKKTKRLANLATETTAPAALIRQIETLEAEREALVASLDSMKADRDAISMLSGVTAADIKKMMKSLMENLESASPESIKDFIGQAVEQIQLSPETYDATITYRIAPASKSGVWMASPRGFEPRLPL